MYIIKGNSDKGYLFHATTLIEWIKDRELATPFHSCTEAKALLIKYDITGHVIPQ